MVDERFRKTVRLLPRVFGVLALLTLAVVALRGWLRPGSDALDLEETGNDRVVYVSQTEGQGRLELVSLSAPASPRILSGSDQDVFDYALSPDGRQAVYTVRISKLGDNSVWLLTLANSERELLFNCPLSMCRSPDWSSTGDQIAYERRPSGHRGGDVARNGIGQRKGIPQRPCGLRELVARWRRVGVSRSGAS